MTIGECLDRWVEMGDADITKFGGALLDLLTPLSTQTMHSFQDHWPTTLTTKYAEAVGNLDEEYKLFKMEQAQLVRKLVGVESSPIGKSVRSAFGLAPITMETELQPLADVLKKPESEEKEAPYAF